MASNSTQSKATQGFPGIDGAILLSLGFTLGLTSTRSCRKPEPLESRARTLSRRSTSDSVYPNFTKSLKIQRQKLITSRVLHGSMSMYRLRPQTQPSTSQTRSKIDDFSDPGNLIRVDGVP